MKKRNILIISGVFLPEPIVSASIMGDLANEMSKEHNVIVLRPQPSRPFGFKLPSFNKSTLPYKIIELNSYVHPQSSLLGRLRESFSMGKYCVRYIKNNFTEIDFIYNAPWQLFGRYMIAKKAKKYNIPFITPVQDIYPESILSKLPKWKILQNLITKLLLPFDKITLSNAAKIHTISDKMKEYLAHTRGISFERFIVISNWQNEKQFLDYLNKNKPKQLIDEGLFTFMYLGNIGPLAGIEVLIDAFIQSNIKESRLVIAGSGSAKEKLINQANQYPDAKIEFWEVPAGEVPETQAKADVMMLPIKKGFSSTSIPSKLPAYMFSAKPVLACVDADSDTALSILNSESGWISESENIEMLKKMMKQISKIDKTKLIKMGGNGFNYAINFFSRNMNLNKLCNACEEVMKKE